MPDRMVAAEIIVSGRVQGVGYRFFTERAAAKHNVRGWSMNLPDGRVALEIEAVEEDAKGFYKRTRTRPSDGAGGRRQGHLENSPGQIQ